MVGQQIGKYRVTRQIGRGGMGAIFEAVHETIGQRVAVKVLHEALSAEKDVVTRFFNEARAVNIVQHPGLVRISDFGQIPGGIAYLIMEYLDGESLSARLSRLGRLPTEMALRLARQMASALAATHAKDIVHRDLKPENVFIIPDPEAPSGERAKLLDFGVAKVRAAATAGAAGGQTATVSGALMGTPLYMAPEQFRGAGAVDGKADVYALGVMLYHMLAGRTPFVSDGMGALMMMHMQDPPPPLQDLLPDVSDGVAQLVHRMLIKEPAQRPSMAEVVAELGQIGAGPATCELPRLNFGDGREATEVAATPEVISTLGLATGAAEPPELVLRPLPPVQRSRHAMMLAAVLLLLLLGLALRSTVHRPQTRGPVQIVVSRPAPPPPQPQPPQPQPPPLPLLPKPEQKPEQQIPPLRFGNTGKKRTVRKPHQEEYVPPIMH